MEKSFFSIFKTFFKVGALLLGGGYVILPLLSSELVDKKGWITSDELCEYYAISTSLPGVIAINTAVFTGRKLLGTKGAIASILGVTLPSFLVIVLLASVLSELVRFNHVNYIFWGVGIGVIALLCFAVKEMWSKCVTDRFTSVIYFVCLILALWGKFSPAIIVILAIITGISVQFIKNRRKSND